MSKFFVMINQPEGSHEAPADAMVDEETGFIAWFEHASDAVDIAEGDEFAQVYGYTVHRYQGSDEDVISKLETQIKRMQHHIDLYRKYLFDACNSAVIKLREIAPELRWDSGDSTANNYVNKIEREMKEYDDRQKG